MKGTGKIISWQGNKGEIRKDNGNIVCFYKYKVSKQELDNNIRVRFYEEIQKVNGISQPVATRIERINKPEPKSKPKFTSNKTIVRKNEYTYIGRITKLDTVSKEGFITSEFSLDTRFNLNEVNVKFNLKLNDVVVFRQGVPDDSKSYYSLKAIFNKIEQENDLGFLIRRYPKFPQNEVASQITLLIDKQPLSVHSKEMSLSRLFKFELMKLGQISIQKNYTELVQLINKYKQANWMPTLLILEDSCSNQCLIKLFEEGFIAEYDYKSIRTFFHRAKPANKYKIAKNLDTTDRYKILSEHIDILRKEGKLTSINNDLKTILDIIYRRRETSDLKLYSMLRSELQNNLQPKEIFELWVDDYISNIDYGIIEKYLSPENHGVIQAIINNNNPEQLSQVRPIVTEYLINQIKTKENHTFGHIANKIVSAFENIDLNNTWILPKKSDTYKVNRTDNIKLMLIYLEGEDIYEKAKYLTTHHLQIDNHFDKVIESITLEALQEYAMTNPWNDKIIPIVSEEKKYSHSSFIHDIEKFNEIFNQKIPVNSLAATIFETIEPGKTVHHIRLWLQGYVDNSFFDYSGFNEAYSQLTEEEKRLFNKKVNKTTRSKLRILQKSSIKPCTIYEKQEDGILLYTAHLENIYFSTKQFQLCIADNKFTKPKYNKNSGTYLNGIGNNSKLNAIEIKIKVRGDEIEDVDNLDQIISKVHSVCKTEDLIIQEKAERSGKSPVYYPVDWNLTAQLNNYFYSKQNEEFDIIFIDESDAFAEYDYDEKSALYTLKCDDGDYAIIWNNVDLTESRAIYIFKAKKEYVDNQLNKLLDHISTYIQFRHTLRKNIVDELHQAFKDNLGYIGAIQKVKGKADAFIDTLYKLERLMSTPTPDIPSEEIQEELETWMLITERIPETTNSYKPNPSIFNEKKTDIPKLKSIPAQKIEPESSNKTINKKNPQPRVVEKIRVKSPQHIDSILNLIEGISVIKILNILNGIARAKENEMISKTVIKQSKTTKAEGPQPKEQKDDAAKLPQHIEGIINLLEDISRIKQETLINDTVEKTDDTTNTEPENSVINEKETIEKVPFVSIEKEEVNNTSEDESTVVQTIRHKQQKKINPLKILMIAIATVAIISALITILFMLIN